jgi:uncharacterized protein YbjQ (UPF0145 family)
MGICLRLLLSLAALCFAVWPVDARNIVHLFPITAALESKDLPEKPSGSIQFFFTKEKSPKAGKTIRSETIDRKARLRGNSNENACHEAFASVLMAFEKRAQEMGANAVVNVVSNYKRREMSSATHFECHEGSGYMAVALRGDFVTLAAQ